MTKTKHHPSITSKSSASASKQSWLTSSVGLSLSSCEDCMVNSKRSKILIILNNNQFVDNDSFNDHENVNDNIF